MAEIMRHPDRRASRVGMDIDGVLAQFNARYVERVVELAGEDLFGDDKFSPDFPPLWAYPEVYGYSADLIAEVWRQISADRGFWLWLVAYPDARDAISRLNAAAWAGTEVVYITSRPGRSAKVQTEEWLMKFGAIRPTVVISGRKGDVCAALDVDAYIDDKLGNVNDVVLKSPSTRVYLLDQPWNQRDVVGNDAAREDLGVVRVAKVGEFLDQEGL